MAGQCARPIYDFPASRIGAAYRPQALVRGRCILRFDAHAVVDGKTQFLLATEVAFRRLD
ncbi:MAG: hypothetical protein JWO19_2077 [Bryobacterales bacterium]|nr:hypothetical protein [Bryobacterales bacterium]